MRSTVPVLLFAIAAPVTQAKELMQLFEPVQVPHAGSSATGAFQRHDAAPSEIVSPYSARITVVKAVRPVLQEIAVYRDMSIGWDGEAGRPALSWSADAATALIETLPPEIPDPVPMIAASGEVGIYWMDGEAYAEIGFEPEGTCFMFAEAPGVAPIHLDDRDLRDPALMAALRRILRLDRMVPLAA